jgi:hypothetical protein
MSFCARSIPARRVFREAAGQVISRKGLTSLARSGTASEDKDAGDRPESRASVGHAFKTGVGRELPCLPCGVDSRSPPRGENGETHSIHVESSTPD